MQKVAEPHQIGTKLNMLLWLSRVDALSKLAGGKFVAKDGAELCSSLEEHFLGKYIQNRGKRHEKAPKERNFALFALCGNEPVKKCNINCKFAAMAQ